MSDMHAQSTIICFGEILWDEFEGGMKPGGAPLNVTYHLRRLGVDSKIISRVGADENGRRLVSLIKGWGISTEFCQVDANQETSRVQAKMDKQYEVQYKILYPVAWDFIALEGRCLTEVAHADVMVFGSLVMRSKISCDTLFELLDRANYRVFDVNLREPFYDEQLIFKALAKADLLKLNQHELAVISNWLDAGVKDEVSKIALIQQKFQIKEILLTKGSKGATYYISDRQYETAGFKISVADTVGSGDAFLAAFLAEKFLRKSPIESQLSMASALGAFVATKHGACPGYVAQDLYDFKEQSILSI